MKGYAAEHWFDTRGFSGYTPGSALTGTAANIAAGMAQRIAGCAAEGQDAVEPDDLDGYTNKSASGAKGGGWGLTQAAAAGYEAWLAFTAHTAGLAIFQKNDTDRTSSPSRHPPCTPRPAPACQPLGTAATQNVTSTTIRASLFNVDLNGKTYQPCS